MRVVQEVSLRVSILLAEGKKVVSLRDLHPTEAAGVNAALCVFAFLRALLYSMTLLFILRGLENKRLCQKIEPLVLSGIFNY